MTGKIPRPILWYALAMGATAASLLLSWGARQWFLIPHLGAFIAMGTVFFILEGHAPRLWVGTRKLEPCLECVFLLGGSFLYGPFFSAAAAVLGQALACALKGFPPIRCLLNLSAPAVAFGISHSILESFSRGNFFSLPGLAGAVLFGLSYFLSGLALAVVLPRILEGHPIRKVVSHLLWRNDILEGCGLLVFVAVPLAVTLVLLLTSFPPAVGLLLIPIIGLYWADWGEREALKAAAQMATTFSSLLDQKDDYTKGHSDNVALYTRIIAEELGLGEEEIRNLETVARMHDIGKIMIKDEVLRKPGRLSEEEYEHMKTHASYTEEFLSGIGHLRRLKYPRTAGGHHEHWDGAGYHRGLKGKEIPLGARIMAVADVFDATTCRRAYRKALPPEKIVDRIKKGAHKQFDPRVVTAFLTAWEKGRFARPLAHNRLWSLLQAVCAPSEPRF